MSRLSIGLLLFMVVLLISACQPLQAPEPMAAITGGFFSTPVDQATTLREYFGNIDVKVLDPISHAAEGTITYNIYDGEMETWEGVQATAEFAVFDDLQQRAVIVARIDETIGNVDGAPGDYACFWVKNTAMGDQIGLHYYAHAFSADPSEIKSRIFWPAESEFVSLSAMTAKAASPELYGDEWNPSLVGAQEPIVACESGDCFVVDGMPEADPSLVVDVAYGDLLFLAGS